MISKIIRYFLENRLITILLLLVFMGWGVATAPFDWELDLLPRDPVPVDAIPDIGENQQVIYADWEGHSPEDVEDQITYPLTTALLGVPGVKVVRSTSMVGFTSIYLIFDDKTEYYWSRSRILEKINALPEGTLPSGVSPMLGPDATALGQLFWYTLEGRDPKTGKVNGGWDLQELRTIQDFYVKYALNASPGVAEVASIGGFLKEYQVDVDPLAMKAANVSMDQMMMAIRNSNLDVGAQTMEVNRVEYLIRGIGFLKSLEDLDEAVVSYNNNVPIRIKDVAHVSFGPAPRTGGLDKLGAEAVGGVIVARTHVNPLDVINGIKSKIKEISPGLPQKTLSDGSVSQVTVVPYYDRTRLIHETLGTLEDALSHEVLISILVVIVLVVNLRASVVIAFLLPVAVLITFIVMRYTGVDANIVALSGIAIAIGVMVDVGIVFVENIVRHLDEPENQDARGNKLLNIIHRATSEVSGAITTAMATTIVSFLPVFAMEAAEGKLFKPLAFTKTFALSASFVIGVLILPTLAYYIFSWRLDRKKWFYVFQYTLIVVGIAGAVYYSWIVVALSLAGAGNLAQHRWPETKMLKHVNLVLTLITIIYFLTHAWLPLGAQHAFITNFAFVIVLVSFILFGLWLMVYYYEPILRWCLLNKGKFLLIPAFTLLLGLLSWIGFDKTFSFLRYPIKKAGYDIGETSAWQSMMKVFPGLGNEFMPSLDEGSFLLMPSTMPHAGVEENVKTISMLDRLVSSIPEVEVVVGKWGRMNSALDPAPISMFENVVNYRPEYLLDDEGHRMRFKVEGNAFVLKGGKYYNPSSGFRLIPADSLVEDEGGEYFRQWRQQIRSADDIWGEIVKVANLPGMTSAPKLQPIQTRLIMLQTGMRAPMGVKVHGPDINTVERVGIQLESFLKEVPGIEPASVFAERMAGKPYLEFVLNRGALARYGLSVREVQETLESAIGGVRLTTTVEGRERYPVRLRYPRSWRDDPEKLKRVMITIPSGAQIPAQELVDIRYRKGPQMIRSENTFLTGYVIFDKQAGVAEVDVVERAKHHLDEKLRSGSLTLPAGVSYAFTGNYENQVRAAKRLSIVIPLSLLMIFILLYLQFRTVTASAIHFSGVFVALAGGFIMLWLYDQSWFGNFSLADVNMRELFQMHTVNLSVAVWVGFIALFGISTNDGVIMGTYIHQVFEERQPSTVSEVREAVVQAGKKRVRPAVMTAAVAIIALLPVLTSTGKGSDIMVPMAIPTFGGMIIQTMTMFVVPVFQSIWRERAIRHSSTTVNQ